VSRRRHAGAPAAGRLTAAVLQDVLAWLTALPPTALYGALAVVAAIENIFPPVPADTIVAFGAFLAARGDASLAGAFLATWLGNVAGALLMYALGRRFGGDGLRHRFLGVTDRHGASDRITRLYARYGIPALFLSRFLPGVRALVPPVAGALRVPAVTASLAIALASALWYGTIAVLAYNVGARWEVLAERISSLSRTAGLAALGVTAVVVLVVVLRRRRRR
jgi:membrane protein DedA with SNARE-associated domain